MHTCIVRMRICTPPVIVVYRLQCGHTALQRAAGGGHLEIVKLLLSHGATVDHQDEVVRSFIGSNCALEICVNCMLCRLGKMYTNREIFQNIDND